MIAIPLVFLLLAIGFVSASHGPINASLASDTSISFAITINFLLGSAIGLVYLVGSRYDFRLLFTGGPLDYLGGLTAASFFLTTAYLVPRLGVGTVIGVNVTAQLIVGIVMDAFGVFGLPHLPLSVARIAGALSLISGALLLSRRGPVEVKQT